MITGTQTGREYRKNAVPPPPPCNVTYFWILILLCIDDSRSFAYALLLTFSCNIKIRFAIHTVFVRKRSSLDTLNIEKYLHIV